MENLLQVITFFVSVFSLWISYRYFNHAHLLNNISTAKIRSAPQGYVELVGRAKSIQPVARYAPLSNTPSVWFEYRFNVGNNEKFLRTSGSFMIDDGTGVCRIDPAYMKIESRNTKSAIEWLDGVRGSLTSRWIGVGDKIHVYGKFTSLDRNYQRLGDEMFQSKVATLKYDQSRMQQVDSNDDGDIDGEEWDTARNRIRQEVDEFILNMQKQPPEVPENSNVLRQPDDSQLPYLVSTFDELTAIRRFRFYALGWFLMFLLAAYVVIDGRFLSQMARMF